MTAARHHHFLPQCYLRGFVPDRASPKLFVVDAQVGRAFTASPRNVAQERDFHTVDVDGMDPDALEKAFAQIESDIAPVLERIARERRVSPGADLDLILNLMALVSLKNPGRREAMRQSTEEVGKQMMRLALASEERWNEQVRQMKAAGAMAADEPADYAGMKAFFESGDYKINLATEAHLGMELRAVDLMIRMLAKRNWSVLRAPAESSGFITCDRPVGLGWSDGHTGFYPPGFAATETTVTFPVCQQVTLLGRFEPVPALVDLSADQVATLNSVIISGAGRQIFARDDAFRYQSVFTGEFRSGRDLLDELARRKTQG